MLWLLPHERVNNWTLEKERNQNVKVGLALIVFSIIPQTSGNYTTHLSMIRWFLTP